MGRTWQDTCREDVQEMCVSGSDTHEARSTASDRAQWRQLVAQCSSMDSHSLANRHSCLTPAKNDGIDINKVGPTEIRHSIAWTNCKMYDQSADNICLSIVWSA